MCKSCKRCRRYRTEFSIYRYENIIPLNYADLYNHFMDEKILCRIENDHMIIDYIKRNTYICEGEFCYISIASGIITELFYINKKNFTNVCIDIVFKFIVDHLFYSFGEPDSDNNELRKVCDLLNRKDMITKYKRTLINSRTGQTQYRKDLLTIHNECQICGMKNEELLIASHIKPYSESDNKECIDFENGLLLCRNHDGVFDRGLITFTDEGQILISSNLNEEDIEKLDILEGQIELSKKQKEYMQWHRENKFKK